MILITEIAILALTLLFIAYPLYNRRLVETGGSDVMESELTDLLYRKEAVYIALKDLEFDYKTGKLDDSDYQEMKSKFEAEAVGLLGRIDEVEKGSKSPKSGSHLSAKKAEGRFCVKCGSAVGDDFNFCGKCGAAIPKA